MTNISFLEELVKSNKDITGHVLYKSISIIFYNLFKNIKALDLQKNNIGSRGVLCLQLFLRRSLSIVQLNLSFNNLCDEGFNYFSETLIVNKSLNKVYLECNCFTDKGFSYFLFMLNFHSSIKVVKLALNLITNIGLDNLTNTLLSTKISFLLIDLKYNNILNDDISKLKALEKNKIFI